MKSIRRRDAANQKLEATILASIDSRHVVRYFDSFFEGDTLYLIMEHCQRGDLAVFMETQKALSQISNFGRPGLGLQKVWRFFTELLRGLAAVHAQGVIHRDLKPANILLSKVY